MIQDTVPGNPQGSWRFSLTSAPADTIKRAEVASAVLPCLATSSATSKPSERYIDRLGFTELFYRCAANYLFTERLVLYHVQR
jgi:hypothetical protein